MSTHTHFVIQIDDLSGVEIASLLQDHLDTVVQYSPPESVHALDLEALRAPEVTFWTAWRGELLAGCAALKELDATHGELKSMKTASSCLRQGVAAMLLQHILDVAKARGYRRLSLETGGHPAFAPAHELYTRFGFQDCLPFADYVPDPYSVFMTREI